MLIDFFFKLKEAKIPVSVTEFLVLLEGMDSGQISTNVDQFYYFSRSCLVKSETNFDKFDLVFASVFRGNEVIEGIKESEIPLEWLIKVSEKYLSREEKAEIEALGGFEELMETLKKRLNEQMKRHQGGKKWIGTSGTSPFGAFGFNPEGIRIGQFNSREHSAIKVWDKREFKDFDGAVEIGTRNIKMALRRLRKFTRDGAETELDLKSTISSTAKRGWLDVQLVPERNNTAKVLLFLDVGGSMDPHIKVVEELFSAARAEFKYLEYYYFHNFLYEKIWQDNKRRHDESTSTWEVINTFGSDYKIIFVGDASMSPYEIIYPGGSVEHWNEEPGIIWIKRMLSNFSNLIWLNPVAEKWWVNSQSTTIIKDIMKGRMYPLTLDGLDFGIRELNR